MSKPEISVICANYNHQQYIEQAITSIMHQTFSDLEILIVDDGSTDNSKDVIESICKLDDRIRKPIYLPQNKGKWFALNTAIAQAQGKLIALNDADDLSHKSRLRRQRDVMEHQNSFHNLCGFANCNNEKEIAEALLWDEKQMLGYDIFDHQEVVKNVYEGYKTPGINHYYMGPTFETHGASTIFYRQHWELGLRFNPNSMGLMPKIAGEDGDHNFRLTMLLQKTSVLKNPLYIYRRHFSTNPSWKLGL
jgi:glycosyltransferase involved in cell wall biosynthesis